MLTFLLLLGALAPQDQPAPPVSPENAEHYRWGDCCDGWYLVKNERLNIIQERVPPGAGETRHLHKRAQQFFFVLSGEASIEIGGNTLTIRRGQGIRVAPGTSHRVMNQAREILELLVTSEPPSHNDRLDVPDR